MMDDGSTVPQNMTVEQQLFAMRLEQHYQRKQMDKLVSLMEGDHRGPLIGRLSAVEDNVKDLWKETSDIRADAKQENQSREKRIWLTLGLLTTVLASIGGLMTWLFERVSRP